MIIMRMKGGLGNQMFQYALGRSLSLKTGLPLVLDRRHYDREREHGFALDGFKLVDMPSDPALLPPVLKERPLAYLYAKLSRRGPYLLREQSLGFDPAIAAVSGPVWLEGYFQSERYFNMHADVIRAELTPASEPDAENARWLAEIEAEPNAVSLHVRRGDYVRNAKFAAHHGTCTPDYYTRALDHIAQQMGAEPVIYAFSDDPEWVHENLRLPAEIRVVGHNDASRNVEDLRLMSACRHHIIANSSFSWWGAWLNPRADKIVTAPAVWFADPTNVNPDIWAEGWVRIEG
ncbi:alpha-1,2-fucosyltransferase [Lentibacter sp. XHP0401]|uniref:alpha-1,2-fucosyltransferase n=1 Tax=Lentibacter sp. XHP0401 TaxID=2984334 RepID=UPI0021E723F0|nr:alpha-1,2-fucosyltransferase [Lentibacter sp. XHP0401]MCV2892260.1 alpha-1,2-fucosyltransferase [Lentibacter sp. XHP0401]